MLATLVRRLLWLPVMLVTVAFITIALGYFVWYRRARPTPRRLRDDRIMSMDLTSRQSCRQSALWRARCSSISVTRSHIGTGR
jgi:hypothetical protein